MVTLIKFSRLLCKDPEPYSKLETGGSRAFKFDGQVRSGGVQERLAMPGKKIDGELGH